MDCLEIKGGTPLHGEVEISGAKNAVLPIMAATLLTAEPCVIRRAPRLADVHTMAAILRSLGTRVDFKNQTLTIQAARISPHADYDLVRKMRGSICVLGPLLARLGQAKVSVPGGCVIGMRPIDLHLKGMEGLGARMRNTAGYVHASAKRLIGNDVFLGGRAGPTVLGTANVLMAATLAKGITIIESAACEPEVVDLATFLNSMGARISGAGSPTITVQGVRKLRGAEHSIIPDRIEAATYAIAGVATRGKVTLKGARADHLKAVFDKLRAMGVTIEQSRGRITCRHPRRFKPVDVTTQPHPGFPTDVQAQMMTLLTLVPDISIITERIFEARWSHAAELTRLGANIAIEGPSGIVKGGLPLSGAPLMASDLRASAALVIGGLVAKGTTRINRIYHLDRGYERMDEKLRKLGAKVKRVSQT